MCIRDRIDVELDASVRAQRVVLGQLAGGRFGRLLTHPGLTQQTLELTQLRLCLLYTSRCV